VPGKSYSFYPELTKDLGRLTTVTLFWKTKSTGLLGGFFARSDYIFLNGDIRVTDQSGAVNVFRPTQAKVESGKDLNARFVRQENVN